MPVKARNGAESDSFGNGEDRVLRHAQERAGFLDPCGIQIIKRIGLHDLLKYTPEMRGA